MGQTVALNSLDGMMWMDRISYVWHCHMLKHDDYEMMRPFDKKEICTPKE
jgi:hypothetical protein